jgi:hypothetical protein
LRLPKTSYTFQETLNLRARNVFPGEKCEMPEPVSIQLSSIPVDVPMLFGRSDHYGLQIVRRDDAIEAYPRLCPHEGSCLDQQSLKGQRSISCGWHGRRFGPIFKISLPAQPAEFVGQYHRFMICNAELRIVPIVTDGMAADADWTAAAAPSGRA